jgi:hypothetical protein
MQRRTGGSDVAAALFLKNRVSGTRIAVIPERIQKQSLKDIMVAIT